MIPISLKEIAEITNGLLIGKDLLLKYLATDTRKLEKNSLFIAFTGNKFNAHHFINDAINKGAQAFLLNTYFPIVQPQIIVNDTQIAFGKIAAWIRQKVKARIIALTGSVGKTSVKEMTASIMRECGKTLYTKDNFNNTIGVPMTLIGLTLEHEYAVIEIGANQIGEIDYSSQLVNPESVLINNLAAAHLEGFGSLTGIARAKAEIFNHLRSNGTIVINRNCQYCLQWQKQLYIKNIWNFSLQKEHNVDFFASNIRYQKFGTQFIMHTPNGDIDITLPLFGNHNVENALAAAALALSVDIPLDKIQNGLKQTNCIMGRLFPIHLSKGKLLLDDTYNANVGSMTAAIDVLAQMPGYKIMVVGDMLELGHETDKYHREIGLIAKRSGIDKIFSIGSLSKLISEVSGIGEHFNHQKSLIEQLLILLSEYPTITILIKSSHNFNMKPIIQSLKEKKYVSLYD
ncbi:UDP-N-acetylmuramoyl-tripeptide--D-alanyl-D-alanine ligase [Candidatus Ishikawella capsulata]|uniref:UDP-N-acetylmuramoyl-tripeptide--D-alanyl-D-alanine ligase n=1 Tax=Candidatus Ishikawaella capsulata Mpkobe TaxID=476281 RepID=C5WD46_9ENTR|nr:UDP-N-acetylmuramoyl-tripeptide--D-alanyl-D-alanine ligase [Candidatus Ishikawaella capsulata]BAH83252.1 UDP-N-acetylmuramoyl-tripeptide:D-alanyl-D-alanine ligase [Candidatus Ishikawaella capsulata Mpkobe]